MYINSSVHLISFSQLKYCRTPPCPTLKQHTTLPSSGQIDGEAKVLRSTSETFIKFVRKLEPNFFYVKLCHLTGLWANLLVYNCAGVAGWLVCFDVWECIVGGGLWPRHGLGIERSVFLIQRWRESASYVAVDLNDWVFWYQGDVVTCAWMLLLIWKKKSVCACRMICLCLC